MKIQKRYKQIQELESLFLDFKESIMMGEFKKLQAEIDRRTEIEKQAIELITQCKFEEAVALLEAEITN